MRRKKKRRRKSFFLLFGLEKKIHEQNNTFPTNFFWFVWKHENGLIKTIKIVSMDKSIQEKNKRLY